MIKRPLSALCLAFLILQCVLLAAGGNAGAIPAESFFAEPQGAAEVVVYGQVYKKTDTSDNQILYLKNNSLIQHDKTYHESNIIVYDPSFSQIPIGKTVCIRGRAAAFEPARNPGNFDQRLYYARQKIYGYIRCSRIVSVSGRENRMMERLYGIRKGWRALLSENMSEDNAALLGTMLLGERSGLDDTVKEQYQKAGISHILAISGLHISFIGLGIYMWLRKTGLSYAAAGPIAAGLLGLYVLMVGFAVSVLRAFVMLLIRILADMTGRVYDALTALSLSAALTVLYQPLCLTDAAFYLSYGALVGILAVSGPLAKLFSQKKWMQGALAGISVNLAVLPVLLWYYFEFPLCSLLLNPVVVPAMSLVLALGMFGSLGCLAAKPLGRLLLGGCDRILAAFGWLTEVSSRLSYGRWTGGRPAWWQIAVYYVLLAGLLLLLRRCREKRQIMKCRAAFACFLVAAAVLFTKFPNGKLMATMIDVGQGDCIFLRGPEGGTYLIDGGSSDVEQVGKYRVEPFLKSQGVGRLDYVFLSHGDADHCSAVEEMLNRQAEGVKICTLVMPANYRRDPALKELAALAAARQVDVAVIKAGQSVREGELLIRCLQPDEADTLEGNAGSMILDVSFRKFDLLLTGDVEGEGEQKLLKRLPDKQYDILKAAHHGSRNSTSDDFLRRVRPKIAWISAGEGNTYGHPHEETIRRLEAYRCTVYQTPQYGAITVETDGDFIDIFPSCI